MSTVEKFLLTALALIALYLVLRRESAQVISEIARGLSGIFKTLQARG